MIKSTLSLLLAFLLAAQPLQAATSGERTSQVSLPAHGVAQPTRVMLPNMSAGTAVALASGFSLPAPPPPGVQAPGIIAGPLDGAAPSRSERNDALQYTGKRRVPGVLRKDVAAGGIGRQMSAARRDDAASTSLDPRDSAFERKAWDAAQRRGFVRRWRSPAAIAAAPGTWTPLGQRSAAPPETPSEMPPPAADRSPSSPGAPAKPPALLSRIVIGFLSNFFLVQVSLEATAVAVSQMTKPLKQGFLGLGLLVFFSSMSYVAGSLYGGRWVDKLGIATSYRAVLVLRTAIWSGVAYLFYLFGGTVPLAGLISLFSVDYFFHSIGRVAESKLKIAWYKNDPVRLNAFGSIRDFLDNGISMLMAGGTGLLIKWHGFQAVLYTVPFMFLGATILSFTLRSLPQFSPKLSKAMELFAGLKFIVKTPGILRPLLGWALINNFVFIFYFILATTFGKVVVGEKEAAAEISGSLISFLGLGAMAAGIITLFGITPWVNRRTSHLTGAAKAQAQRLLAVGAGSKALKLAALGMLGSWAFLFTAPLMTIGWPIFPISIALVAIGLSSQTAATLLETIWNDRIPQDKAAAMGGSIVGAARAISYGMVAISAILWALIFQAMQAQAFVAVALYGTLSALVYLRLSGTIRNP